MKQTDERSGLLEESATLPVPLKILTPDDFNLSGRNFAHPRRRAALFTTTLLVVAAIAGTRAYTSGSDAPAKNLAWTPFFTHSLMDAADSVSANDSPDPEATTITIDDAGDACIVTTSPANNGYDVVAYFSLKPGDDAVKGFVEHSFEYQGYSYYFATKANLETFKASPKTYVPQWGGFCSYGVSSEDWWTWVDVKQGGPMADPDVWMVRDGKLYLFMYEVPKRKFLEGNVDARIKAGMARWTEWVGSGSIDAYANTACYWTDALCGQNGDACVAAKDTLH